MHNITSPGIDNLCLGLSIKSICQIFVLESCLNLIDINLEEKEYADACPSHVRRIARRISSDLCMYSESFLSDIDVIEYKYNSSHKFHRNEDYQVFSYASSHDKLFLYQCP